MKIKNTVANQFSKWKNIMVENSFFQFNEHQVDVDKLNKLISLTKKIKRYRIVQRGNLNNGKLI